MTWRLIEESSPDVYKNLALEEALARVNAASELKINTLRFWRSEKAVVIGRFQCVHKEANIGYCQENDIPIARRFTGGGAVYHDEGNLNFTICLDQSEPYVTRTLNELYWNFIGFIASGLQEIGIPVRYDTYRNCLRIKGKKISGTAGWIKQGVSFIHGTLLVDADLSVLKKCLTIPPDQPVYARDNRRIRCVESKRDIVTTIHKEVVESPSDKDIMTAITQSLERLSEEQIPRGNFSQEERDYAESLYQDLYSQSNWNLGTLAQG
ncbi:MAG: lipoate--protein ligase family protein [Candidatus Thorarchaeota archaeon]|jgi:lipoate-protein ligase A